MEDAANAYIAQKLDEDFDDYYASTKDPSSIGIDESKRRFYENLSELPSSWIPLENLFYRNTQMGEMELGSLDFHDWPQLNYFYYTQARNGGPIGKSQTKF